MFDYCPRKCLEFTRMSSSWSRSVFAFEPQMKYDLRSARPSEAVITEHRWSSEPSVRFIDTPRCGTLSSWRMSGV